MNVSSFQVCNFKSIGNPEKICLPKITLLIGPNSSGKSSIFQSLLLMKQTFEAREPSMPLVLNGPYISLGEYSDFIHNKNHTKCFWIKFNFESRDEKIYKCEVCDKSYTDKNWYQKHIENNHSKYWDVHKARILNEKHSPTINQSLKFSYSFDSETSIIRLKELEYENPPVVDGLALSSLKISQYDSSIRIELFSKNKKKIYTRRIKNLTEKDSVDHFFFSRILFNYLMPLQYRNNETINDINNEVMATLDKDYGNVLKSKVDKEGLKSEIYQESMRSIEISPKENRAFSVDEKLAIGIEIRLFAIALSLTSRLEDISIFLEGIHHIGPLRTWPERVYFGTGGKPISVGGKGEYTQEILWLDKRIGHDNLINKINEWLIKLKLDIELEIEHIKGDMYQLKVIQNGLNINVADVGFGISQILPILTECLDYSTKKSSQYVNYNPYFRNYLVHGEIERTYRKMIICQQPEIHLNPKIQSELGDFFTQIDDPNLSLLIETHSEHILTRLQRRVADGTLDSKDIAIYFVSNEQNCSNIKNLSISKRGEFDSWPEGFFQDDYEDTIEILKASLKDGKGE